MDTTPPRWLLPAIVVAQLLATSLWFAPNAVIGDLQQAWAIDGGEGIVTTAVQLGFIAGTLCFALLAIADRFHPGNVFLASAFAGAVANASVLLFPEHFGAVLAARFIVGFCLAGVYPVGMKMAAGWYGGGLGRALGFLVGALALGTASAHLISAVGADWSWQLVLLGTSALAVIAGIIARSVPEGPNLKRGSAIRFAGVFRAFRVPRFRSTAMGYFGHMWELYALWAFMPVWFVAYGLEGQALSLAAFMVIAVGALGCVFGGLLVERFGGGRVAITQLGISALCCLLSPLMLAAPPWLFALFIVVWGITAAGDSPQFSALNARNAPADIVGSALTLTNCIGFSISIGSLMLLEWLQFQVDPTYLMIALLPGPLLGLLAARPLWTRQDGGT